MLPCPADQRLDCGKFNHGNVVAIAVSSGFRLRCIFSSSVAPSQSSYSAAAVCRESAIRSTHAPACDPAIVAHRDQRSHAARG
ncbi:hypothetical protein WS71_08390 [Burkholderia mayonis]|uniref:Uncharacterized protein n=1 Tax=Burkholderia mayonis TaxID=1385591 RepID=A0A1B4FUK8_9BURK|nr:hypothetical protein WS71_08390 [Burkholderia mayonis]KVE45810.1 hypothetical protein WS71_23460 [Burkholderia mayonis]